MIGAWLRALRAEWRALLGKPGVLVVLIGGTLFYGLFYPLPYRDQVARNVPVAVVDLDDSATSRALIRMLDATEQVAVRAHLPSRAEGERWLRDGTGGGLVVIPRDFERALLRGEPVRVGIWGNAAYMLLYSQVANAGSTVVGTLSAGVVLQRLELQGEAPATAMARAQAVGLEQHTLFNPGGGYGSYVVPAVLVLILQQTLLIGIGMMGPGGLPHLPGPARSRLATLLGRMLPYFALHMALAVGVLTLVFVLYDFPHQSPLWLSLWLLLPFVLATVCFGMALSSLFDSSETALQCLMLMSIPALFLAGFAWPAQAMPAPLVWLGWLLPSTAGIDVFIRGQQMGADFAGISASWLVLWGQALVYGVLAWWAQARWRPAA